MISYRLMFEERAPLRIWLEMVDTASDLVLPDVYSALPVAAVLPEPVSGRFIAIW